MLAAAALATLLAAQPAPDLALGLPPAAGDPASVRLPDRPFAAGELLGAGGGLLAGDLAFLALAVGSYQLVVNHQIAPTVGNFRLLGIGLATAALVLPPLGATLGAKLFGNPGGGRAWKAFLLAFLGNAAAVVAGYYSMPTFWAIVPVQLATMTTGASLGLHWGPAPRAVRAPSTRGEPPDPRAAPRAPALAWARPVCADAGR